MTEPNPLIVPLIDGGEALHRYFRRLVAQRAAEIAEEARRAEHDLMPPPRYRPPTLRVQRETYRRPVVWPDHGEVSWYDGEQWITALRDEPDPSDAMTMRFDLEPTETCWKDVSGIECGEPSDPESETGVCAKHLSEVRDRYRRD